jgi:hypothetical protein
MKEICVTFLNIKKSKQNHQEMFTVWGVTFFGLTSEDFSATLQDTTSTLAVHPKHI